MNDSDTEFVAEDETVISINGNMNKGNFDQNRSISAQEASIHTLSLQGQ